MKYCRVSLVQFRRFGPGLAVAVALAVFPADLGAGVAVRVTPDLLEIENATQRLAWRKGEAGDFRLTTYARRGDGWQPVFDGEVPLVQGPNFDLHPTTAAVLEDTPERVVAEVGGRHPRLGYAWSARFEAKAETSWIHCRVSCQLREPLILAGLEPQVALWSRDAGDAVVVDQGPGNIYHGPPEVEWGNSFPGEHTVASFPVSTDYAVDSACDPAAARKAVLDGWDFSTCNNYLAGWLAHDRLHPNPARHRFLEEKLRALPLFFDPEAQLFRHGTRYPRGLGPKEMSWQNFAFAIEVDKIRRVLPPRERDPAVTGKFLRGADTLADFARRVDYLFPQWFDPITQSPLPQGDLPELGMIQEPWQAGSYAWIQCAAHEISGDPRHLAEARTAVDRLLGGLRFWVKNDRYDLDYTDPVDFPVTEIFGNAWGVAAGARLHALTGDDRYLRASDDFLNSLLRLTYWYESVLRGDPRDQAVRTAGLFRNHGGAYTGSPWENGEAYLALSVRLRADLLRGAEPREPLLRLFHLFRYHSATFFPPTFAEAAQPCERVMAHRSRYLPIEDTYTLEHGGRNGGMGRAAYMSGIAFWNEVLFEALAQCDDPEVMVLNLDALDGFAASAASIERHFAVFNAAPEARTVRVLVRGLTPGDYRVELRADGTATPGPSGTATKGEPLGVDVALRSGRYALLTIRAADAPTRLKELRADEATANALARRYRDLQTAAAKGASEAFSREKADYLKQLAAFRAPVGPPSEPPLNP